MRELREPQQLVEGVIREHLQLVQRKGIDIRNLLRELAQWHGVLVPVEHDRWQFAHKSIHDYLAARFWVESGTFAKQIESAWDARVAYALCLSPDATSGIKESLDRGNTLSVISECMYNYAAFQTEPVADSLLAFFQRATKYRFTYHNSVIRVDGPSELLRLASDRFLFHIIMGAWRRASDCSGAVIFTGLAEALRRNKPLDDPNLAGFLIRQFGSTTPIEVGEFKYVLRQAFLNVSL